MDFRQFVTEYFSEKLDRDPSSLADGGMQELLDLSRKQDLDSREEQLSEADDKEEVMEVDAQPLETAGSAQKQEPPTDSGTFEIPADLAGEEASPAAEPAPPVESEELPSELVEFKATEQVVGEVESERELEDRYAALTDEDILPTELTEQEPPAEDRPIESVTVRSESELLGAKDVPFDLVAAIDTIESDIRKAGDDFELATKDYDLPDFSDIPDDINKEMNSIPKALNLDGLRIAERSRWS